jgi:hypothetical protein
MKITNNRDELVTLALHGESGLNALATTIGVAQNTAPRLATDLQALVGEPGSLTNTGAQGLYNKKHAALTDARAARNAARLDGRELCTKAIDSLKAHLGRSWNPRWTAAGFGGQTLTIRDTIVAAKLLELRNYYRDNAAREVASEGLTAAAFEAKHTALQAAEQARDAAISAFRDARDARDEAQFNLKTRLSGLQEELGKLLSPSDNRWADFGFPRPIDGSIPGRVEGLTLTPSLPGSVLARWEHSPRAVNYRVSWKPQGSSGDPIEVGLYGDGEATLSGLPSGVTIDVFLTARNNAGETQPTSATIVVP